MHDPEDGVDGSSVDFWNAWNQTTERNLVRDCINAAKICGNV